MMDKLNEPVEICLFAGGNAGKSPLFVQVNGRNMLIRRGERVTVPRYIADIIVESERAGERTVAVL